MLKYIPIVIAVFYMLNTIFALFNIDMPVLSNLAGMSLFTWLFMYIAAWVFQFCIYHRMFLYYILVIDVINITDYYIGIPVENFTIIMIHNVILCISIILILYFYVKDNKKVTSKYSRKY